MSKVIKTGSDEGAIVQHQAQRLEKEKRVITSSHLKKYSSADQYDIDFLLKEQRDFLGHDLEQKTNDAYARGFFDGKTAGEAVAKQEFEHQLNELRARSDTMVHSIQTQHHELRTSVEETIVKLAIEIASRIVKREIEQSSIVIEQAIDAMKRVLGVEKIKLKIHPDDESLVRTHRSDIQHAADSVKEMVIETDEKIQRGGCIVESELGNVDAKIGTQFKQIENAFEELRTKSAEQ